ncbi:MULTISPECIES: YihY/virulence factor BrkB family protein [unclassified Rothia (in: high G+C Gram-positive bacteria)]|uniref:YihY/virulence factor BrkB family protein n=1 Tax=unclassified Rothia (in: high G+C Gram-positive bacteria) TaxID=2689056 RepID=UPI00195E6866|nr:MULTISPECIES: YihY/virulence factor BrkB family protein [unclassified Rothia (in: high G+C Gram-positive bacteria)]MBM7050963.1 YihY/virulence factor BrkB family protein [Rothia sp. ZJ1223]QRZ62306.1 YihY/virulence factor BrkB family protein [Rothia sp. ZJ932]
MQTPEEQTIKRAEHGSDPRSGEKPQKLTQLGKPSWIYIFKRSLREFLANGSTDLAAALTYFAVFSIMPMLLALVSLLGVFGHGQQTTDAILNFLSDYAPKDILGVVEQPISQLTASSAAGLALVTGLVGSLWTASGYVGAFGRALNRIYGVVEGRPIWKLRPINLVVTLIMVLIMVSMMMVLLTSKDVLDVVGDFTGMDFGGFAAIWNYARWAVMLIIAIILVGVLYFATPNVKQPKFRWISPGAAFALIMMGVAGAGFTFYVSNFANYNATYGAIGGVIVMLMMVWIMNNVLLFGAQIDAEIQRARELHAGIPAEETLKIEPRDDTMAIKNLEKLDKLVEEGREIRLQNNSGMNMQEEAAKNEKENINDIDLSKN